MQHKADGLMDDDVPDTADLGLYLVLLRRIKDISEAVVSVEGGWIDAVTALLWQTRRGPGLRERADRGTRAWGLAWRWDLGWGRAG